MNIEHFKMLDQITGISIDNDTLVSRIDVQETSTIFDFHFPDNPIMPGVLLIEIMAQSAGYLAMAKLNFNSLAILAKVSHCKFASFVSPGDALVCEVTILSSGNGFTANKARIFRDDTVVATAEFRMKTLEFPNVKAKQVLVDNFKLLTEEYSAALEEG